ncbi:MAG: hypothetical protein LUI60_05660, partial [Clostridia bacterium]|nr:hypothetical protein [Clostridia bacterium]
EYEYYLDIYEKTSVIFALCYVTYSNGFTVWSKIAVKKVKGSFRNMQKKCRILYSSKNGDESFSVADSAPYAVGGVFFTNRDVLPQTVEKADNLQGLYSPCGLMTLRPNNLRYSSPQGCEYLKLDLYCDNSANVNFTIHDIQNGEIYSIDYYVTGGVWQGALLERKNFKNRQGVPLSGFDIQMKLIISCSEKYAVNNIMWL